MAEKKTTDVTYVTLSADDQILVVRDLLRGVESDHLRIRHAAPADDPSTQARLETLTADIVRLQGELSTLESSKS